MNWFVKVMLFVLYIIGWWMWYFEYFCAVYFMCEKFMVDCVFIFCEEIEVFWDFGVNIVQFDEFWFVMLVDFKFCENEGVIDVSYEMDLCVDLINQIVVGFDGIEMLMYLCYVHFDC